MSAERESIADEIERTRPDGRAPYGDHFSMQIRSEEGRTFWLIIPADRFDAVKAAAAGESEGK